jgi:3-phosphoshikimate 1-carboxyvinyltransferase
MSDAKLSYLVKNENFIISIPSSKSISNRALLIQSLCKNEGSLNNLSTANDTVLMEHLLKSTENSLDAEDAGTVYRFLCAYALFLDHELILTGSKRMCERPIYPLVNALRDLGAKIEYLRKEGYPPLRIYPFKEQLINKIKIPANLSSQYISSLLMIAPKLNNGLELELVGKIASRPYIEMTLNLMKFFGVDSEFNENIITVKKQNYHMKAYSIEADFSSLSYWYSILALSPLEKISFTGFNEKSLQGDSILISMMEQFGIISTFENNLLVLKKSNKINPSIEIDFSNYPDLALGIVVLAASLKLKGHFTGLESLKIKESDRILALVTELKKCNVICEYTESSISFDALNFTVNDKLSIKTYKDHRIAMAFAPLAFINPIVIENTDVVKKSYPSFWDDLRKIGFQLEIINKE